MNMMRRLKSIASGRTSISSDPVSLTSHFVKKFLFLSFLTDVAFLLLLVMVVIIYLNNYLIWILGFLFCFCIYLLMFLK